jgi:hypothetical protein
VGESGTFAVCIYERFKLYGFKKNRLATLNFYFIAEQVIYLFFYDEALLFFLRDLKYRNKNKLFENVLRQK